jgi:hypothetical protein
VPGAGATAGTVAGLPKANSREGIDMKLKVLAVLGVASLGVGSGLAAAHTASYNSRIEIKGDVGATVQDFQVYGEVHSPKGKCVPNRKVKIFSITPSGLKLIDTDRTSRNGFFFGGGNFGNEVNGARVKVVQRDVGRRSHVHLCKSDTDTLPIV